MKHPTQNTKHLAASQYTTPSKLHARWDLYTHTVPYHDIYQLALDKLNLTGNEHILDVGCGDGNVLKKLYVSGHTGTLTGIEITQTMFDGVHQDYPSIHLLEGSADHIPLQDNSVEVILAFFMLYHMPDIMSTLQEWKRVLHSDGKLIVATSSNANKPKHKQFKLRMGELTHSAPISQFSSSFNMENGLEQLQKVFSSVQPIVFASSLQLTSATPYIESLSSVRDMYDPIPSSEVWNSALDHIRRDIDKEIHSQGIFRILSSVVSLSAAYRLPQYISSAIITQYKNSHAVR